MMISVPYTHEYDRQTIILKCICIFGWFFLVMGVADTVLDPLWNRAQKLWSPPDWVAVVFLLVVLFPSMLAAGLLHRRITEPWLNAMSARLYVKHVLKTSITFSDAKFLSPLLSPNEYEKWCPFTEILELPIDRRREALLAAAKRMLHE